MLSSYLVKTRHVRFIVNCCLTSKRRQRSGMSAEYAFATTASSALTVEYRTATSSESAGATSAPSSDWYQQQLTALLQVQLVEGYVCSKVMFFTSVCLSVMSTRTKSEDQELETVIETNADDSIIPVFVSRTKRRSRECLSPLSEFLQQPLSKNI